MHPGAMLKMKWCPKPPPPPGSYNSKTVLVTGGTSGIGLAAAVQYLTLGAAHVIITARSADRGETARAKIEAAVPCPVGADMQPRVSVQLLDMDSYESIVALVDTLRTQYSARGGVDVALLNAGVQPYNFTTSKHGYENSIQVNTISTGLLGALLLVWMRELRPLRDGPARLVLTSSVRHAEADVDDLMARAEAPGGVLKSLSTGKDIPGWMMWYNNSKLFLQYAVEELAKMALGPDGVPQVIVVSFCPGAVKTDLARDIGASSIVMRRVVIPLYVSTLSQSPEVGTRICADAGLAGPEDNGKFLLRSSSDTEYAKESAKVMTSPKARELQAIIWGETKAELVRAVPELQATLSARDH